MFNGQSFKVNNVWALYALDTLLQWRSQGGAHAPPTWCCAPLKIFF